MADTYTATITGIIAAASKTGLAIWNTDASKVVRIYRAWVLNNQTANVTGLGTLWFELHRITACSSGRSGQQIITSHMSSAASGLSTTVNAFFDGPTVTKTSLLRRCWWGGSDEKVANVAPTIDEVMSLNPYTKLWDSGFNDTVVEPLVLRQNEGFSISWGGTASPTGTADFIIEFTVT
jgi:hypothetical protein